MRRELLVVLCLGAAACGSSRSSDEPREPAPYAVASLVVENQDFKDYRIYIVNEIGLQYKLGTIQGNQIQEYRIPDTFSKSGASVRFMAIPLASPDRPSTQQIVLTPGDQITIRITP